MNTQHSPAPWSISGIPGDEHVMAMPKTSPKMGKMTVAIVPGSPRMAEGEQEANKQLIFAAPDLLAACKEALFALKGYKDSGDEHDWEAIEPFHKSYAMLRAAIAKAEGKP